MIHPLALSCSLSLASLSLSPLSFVSPVSGNRSEVIFSQLFVRFFLACRAVRLSRCLVGLTGDQSTFNDHSSSSASDSFFRWFAFIRLHSLSPSLAYLVCSLSTGSFTIVVPCNDHTQCIV